MGEIRRQRSDIPDRLRGKWAVVSARTDQGDSFGGEILDEWLISSDTMQVGNDVLHVSKVEELDEPDQSLVLVSFSDNSLQYSFMSALSKPDAILVVAYLGREERMRCAITQAVYRTPS